MVKEGTIIKSSSTQPLVFDGLTVRHNGRNHIFLVNYTMETRRIYINGGEELRLFSSLNIENVGKFMSDPDAPLYDDKNLDHSVELMPYSLNWLTTEL
jgi:hypothetical protein